MRITTKSTAICASALALMLPLTACGSGDGESGGLSTAAEAPSEVEENASAESETNDSGDTDNKDADKKAEDANDAAKQKAKEAGDGGNAGAAGEAPQIANPFENGIPENTNQPLASGKEGSAEDKRQMEEVARAVLNPENAGTWTRTILDNSCKAVTDPMMEELDRQGVTLDQIEESYRLAESQGQGIDVPRAETSISDVRVDGKRASANLTVKGNGQEQTEVMIFEKEDGRWKLCN